MKKAIALALVAAASVSGQERSFEEIADIVNKDASSTWKAAVPSRFNSTEEARTLCGTWLRGHPKYMRLPEKKIHRAAKLAGLKIGVEAAEKELSEVP